MLKKFLDEFSKIYQNWLDFGFSGIRRLWLKNAYKLNEKININIDNKSIEGIFSDLDLDGNLIIPQCDLKKIESETTDNK
jgi:BirA family biotin operon repressor/biotin-[acetyl-CoA-carboxylase] ligase